MKKNLRLLIISFAIIVTSFILTGNVFAFENNQKGTHTHTGYVTLKDAFKYQGYAGTQDYLFYRHYMNVSGKDYNAYCLDGVRFSSGNGKAYKVESVLNPEDAKDAVILTIINDDASYDAKVLAVRAFLPFTKYISTKVWFKYEYAGDVAEIYANYNSGIVWAAEDLESIKAILGLKSNPSTKQLYELSGLGTPSGYAGFSEKDILVTSNSTVKEAKDLYMKALKVGAAVAKGQKLTDKDVVFSMPVYESDPTKTPVGDDAGVVEGRYVKFDITFNKFNDDSNTPVNVTITPDTHGKMATVKMYYKNANEDSIEENSGWKEFDANTDFRPLLTKDSVTLKFRVVIKATVNNGETFSFNFKINVGYEDLKTVSSTGALMVREDGDPQFQRFFIGEGDSNDTGHVDKTFEVPFTHTDVPEYCANKVPNKSDSKAFKEYIELCCRGNNDEGFNIKDACDKAQKTKDEAGIAKWCKLKEEYCDYCNDKITIPQTCSEISPQSFINEEDKVATITGPEDIKVCVMNGLDEANHSYLLTKDDSVKPKTSDNDNGNPYCKVSCKEDYRIQLPTARYVNNGTKFTLKMDIEAQKTCYTDMIDYTKFNEDYDRYVALIESFVNAGTANTSNQEFVNALNGYNKAIKDINSCSAGWKAEYEFDPEVTFDYQEEYIDLLGQHDLKFVSEDKKVKELGSWFCDGNDVDAKYNSCIGGKEYTSKPTTTKAGYKCTLNSDGKTYKCEKEDKAIPTAKYAKKTVKGLGTYAPEAMFYTKYSTGIVKVNPDGSLQQYTKLAEKLAVTIPDSDKEEVTAGDLPIALKTGRGVYNYGLKFKNIGEYFDKEGMGRLVGDQTAVAFKNGDTEFKGIYVCSYIVNCKDCEVKCVEPSPEDLLVFKNLGIDVDLSKFKCEITDEPCPECDVQCEGACVYDPEHGQLYTVHQTSLTDFNASNRELGANLTTEKGQAFIRELEEKGESIYEKEEYSFVFTPAAIEFVRQINAESDSYTELPKEWEDKSLYINYSDLVKEQVKLGKKTEKDYQEALKHDYKIYQSSVLDELARTTDAIKVKALIDTRESVESWLDSDYCKANLCAMYGAIGPAWK